MTDSSALRISPDIFRSLTKNLSLTKSLPELETFIYESLHHFGIIKLAYHHLPQIGSLDTCGFNVLHVGFPAEFSERFNDESRHISDPTIPIIMAQAKPVWWGDVDLPPKISAEEMAYLKECLAADFGTGLTLPVFGPLGRNGFISVGFGHEKPKLSPQDISPIQMFFQSTHLHYCDLLTSEFDTAKKLSNREREILTWIARGKGNAVIADILGIKESSVVTYIQRTFDKLGVNNRVTASLRALAIGELSL